MMGRHPLCRAKKTKEEEKEKRGTKARVWIAWALSCVSGARRRRRAPVQSGTALVHAGDCRTGLLSTEGSSITSTVAAHYVVSLYPPRLFCQSDVDVDEHINMLQAPVLRVQFHDRGVTEFVTNNRKHFKLKNISPEIPVFSWKNFTRKSR